MRFMDTMSMHIACSGFTSVQRELIINGKLKDESITESKIKEALDLAEKETPKKLSREDFIRNRGQKVSLIKMLLFLLLRKKL
jgi:hypothetical protein